MFNHCTKFNTYQQLLTKITYNVKWGQRRYLYKHTKMEVLMKKKVRKIVVVDDDKDIVMQMEKVARSAGHEVLSMSVGPNDDLSTLAEKIKGFSPDMVFLDHDLNRFETGKNLAEMLSFPLEKLIGTSTAYRQPYCGKTFDGKKSVGQYGDLHGTPDKLFLKMIKK